MRDMYNGIVRFNGFSNDKVQILENRLNLLCFLLSNWRYLQWVIRYNGFSDDNFSRFERRFNSKNINFFNYVTIGTK